MINTSCEFDFNEIRKKIFRDRMYEHINRFVSMLNESDEKSSLEELNKKFARMLVEGLL